MIRPARIVIWCTVALLTPLIQAPTHAQPARVADETTLHDLRVDVGYLSSDLLKGRETGTDGERLAAQYIAERFRELRLDSTWTQPFDFTYSPNPHASPEEGEPRTGRNVVGHLDRGAAHTVVIGAHYDHLGYGGVGSRAPGDSLIHNGADDNASGVAALLEIAHQLQSADAEGSNVLFVGFSGEELGLYGSKHFVDALSVLADRVSYMINLDMVGRLGDERRLAVNGTGTSPAWDAALDAAAGATDITLAEDPSGLGASDHTSFYLDDIPAVHLFTGAHDDYHTPADDSHRIDYDGLHDVATFAVRLVEALDDDGALAFTETDDEQQGRRMSFDVTFGIMPDYVFEGEGMRIDAVTEEDGPAARAGLQEDDVIVRVGSVAVDDIYAYMDALGQLETGDTVPVVVERDEQTLEKTVQF
ncbi:M20/M25/M40 family metallo-hydrolase [Salinibacter altiplanensis]|uniref:M20/M25/M40 family metallo-hydrolase n=1 Tax=Salinibacter altiplanensis TaxID=1803181 RepID=UPI000C9F80A2|nr:M20/M25/M40 family metallo-hydrolase [Salinibacter altiplanensis]